MKASYYKAVALLIAFFVLVFTVSLAFHRHYPMLIIAGEDSVGTWMSGALLMLCATTCLIMGMRQGWYPWVLVTIFFIVLALDERFMFHERLKERIIFSFHSANLPHWCYELPVIVGACVGALIARLLWHYVATSRMLLLCATVLGTASVAIDVLAAGILWEECCKLLAELRNLPSLC